MLKMYEIFFELPPGKDRNQKLITAIRDDFESNIAAFVKPAADGSASYNLMAADGGWTEIAPDSKFTGPGIESLVDTHKHAPGALTFTRVRRPAAFAANVWESLWHDALGEKSMALLSVETRTDKADRIFLWLVQTSYSREWNSQDRELAEEIAALLARAADKESDG